MKRKNKSSGQIKKQVARAVKGANPVSAVESLARLANTLKISGKYQEAIAVYKKLHQLRPEDPAILINAGNVFQLAGNPEQAIQCFCKSLELQPNNVAAHYNLALAYQGVKQLNSALQCYRSVLQYDPGMLAAQLGVAQLLNLLGSHEDAELHYREALLISPGHQQAVVGLGQALMCQGRAEEALLIYESALEKSPGTVYLKTAIADLYERLGETDRAWDLVSDIEESGEISGAALEVYARLCRKFGNCEHAVFLVEMLLQKVQQNAGEKQALHFLAGSLYDRLESYDSAFQHYKSANNLAQHNFDRVRHTKYIDELIAAFSFKKVSALPTSSNRNSRPVFIVGMPRSGTSLTEQILASHPDIFGAGELPRIEELSVELQKSSCEEGHSAGGITSVGQAVLDEFANKYFDHIDSMNVAARRVVDKMPLNFLRVGVIVMLFPEARIIHCRRNALDTCLSIYSQNLPWGHSYATNLGDLGYFYCQYERLMRHWEKVFPGRMLEVSYEELVNNQEKVSRNLIEFCGLDWDEHCMSFQNTQRFVATASYDQVRQPMHNRSIGRWKYYECYLSGLREALDCY